MGANAATKAYKVVHNLERILAIELFNAAQALDFRRPKKSSPFIENFVAGFRKKVPFVSNDDVMYTHIHNAIEFLNTVELNIPSALVKGV